MRLRNRPLLFSLLQVRSVFFPAVGDLDQAARVKPASFIQSERKPSPIPSGARRIETSLGRGFRRHAGHRYRRVLPLRTGPKFYSGLKSIGRRRFSVQFCEDVNFRIHTLLFSICFLAACDREEGGGHSAGSASDASKPGVTRADRSRDERLSGKEPRPRDALSAAKKIEDPVARDKALAELVWRSWESDPEISVAALELISTDSEEKIPLIEFYAMQLAKENPDEALAWARSLGSSKETATATGQVIEILAEKDHSHAARLLPKPGTDGGEIDGTSLLLLHRWMSTTPKEAAAWVFTFPSGEARTTAVQTVVSDWMESDSEAAFSWLGTLGDHNAREEVQRALLEVFRNQPKDIRERWIEGAPPVIKTEFEDQHGRIPEETEGSTEVPSE